MYIYICINPAINPLILPKARTAQRFRDRSRPEPSAVDAALPCSACTGLQSEVRSFFLIGALYKIHDMDIYIYICIFKIFYVINIILVDQYDGMGYST